MSKTFWTRIGDAERQIMRSFGKDITSPKQRFLSHLHFSFFDHAILRGFWTNFFEIAPGVYRSNHPTHRRFRRYKKMGIKSVINLRGEDKFSFYLFEKEICEELGLTLIDTKMWARNATKSTRLLAVVDAMRTAEKPLVFHCKSGADRTGIAAAMYLLIFEGASIAEARKQLGLRYVHLKFTKTGVQDYILDVYEARQESGEIGFEDWLRDEYDASRIQAAFDANRPAKDVALPA
ncbi:Protein tyrosine/serine phosphatase [Roseivivax halotolerans]|uniref:Protein tyrosine/serine phosphatase n=1 Tax=Roseivivax halotolerans TaxID=93684 RepID=A0A1I6A1M7_9RHOB|nr:tyrosine-protein phosphatase [Roseivivax halotolerans]SFQ62595.1 Protein tyrosine/serine phosphatase [Roseivivax halotolerans]